MKKEDKMRRILLIMVLVGLAAGCFGVVESPEIEFSNPVTYVADGKVWIKRDTGVDEMLLKDDSITSAVRLETLVNAGGVSVHDELTGLGADDHTQYYDSSRLNTKLGTIESGSGATYVNSLPISGAVGDADTIGEFVSDITIQYKRPGGTAVVATTNGQFNSIPLAIAWLGSNYGTAGGTVRIHPGTYSGGFTMPQNIRLVGEPGVVIEYGNIGGDCIVIGSSALGCELDNLTLRSTNTTGQTQAIYINFGSTLVMRNCVIDWDSSASNVYSIYALSILTAYNCILEAPDFALDLNSDAEWIGGKISNTLSGQTWPVAIGAGSDAIFRDVIIDAYGADIGIQCDSAGVGYLYGVTIDNAVTDLGGAFGTFYTAGSQYEIVGEFVQVIEITEGRATQLRNYIEKAADATDYAYRYRLDEITKFSVDYLGNIYAAGDLQAANIQGGSNVITVAKFGGDYQTIQEAMDSVTDSASTNTYVVLVYPGIYEEEVTIDKSYISLVGWDKSKCIIQDTPTGAKRDLVRVYSSSGAISNITIANLTLYNTQTWGGGGSAAQEAIDFGTPNVGANAVTDCRVYNCILKGYQDTVFCYPNSAVIWENCYIYGGFDIASCWNATVEFHNCHFYTMHTSGGNAGFHSGGIVVVEGCLFTSAITGTAGAWDLESATSTLYFYNNTYGAGIDIGLSFAIAGGTVYAGGNYGKATEPSTGVTWGDTGGATFQNAVNISGDTTMNNAVNINLAQDDVTIIGADLGGTNYRKRYVGDTGKTEWSVDAGSPSWDVNLYPNSGDLETDDLFRCNTLEIGTGTAPANGIGSQGIISSTVSLKSCETRWKDYDAVSWVGSSEWTYTGPNDYLFDNVGDKYCYFPIIYEAGTTVSRVRVKYDGGTGIDGVDYRVVKRQDSGTASGWTLVGVLQSVASDVMVVDTYDIPDFDIDEGYSYAIEIMSVVDGTDVKLYAIGIETVEREW